MLTPQDIQNKEFGKAVFGGYDMAAVDDFLEELTDDYASLYKENAILKSKMKVLVEKVEEYRATEDAMRMALVTAQKTGDSITRDATEKSTAMVSEAEEKSRTMVSEAEQKSRTMVSEAEQKSRTMIEKADAIAKGKVAELVELTKIENERLEKAMANSRQFIEATKKMAEKQLQFLDALSQIEAKPVELPDYDFLVDEVTQEDEPAPETADVQVEESPAEEPAVTAEESADEPYTDEADESDAAAKEAEILDTAKQIDENMASILSTAPSASPTPSGSSRRRRKARDIDWDDDDEPTSPRPKFDFTDLKFGKNFESDTD